MNQARNPNALQGKRGVGNNKEKPTGAVRLDTITETLAGTYPGTEDDDSGAAEFGASIEAAIGKYSRDIQESLETAGGSRNTFNGIQTGMFGSGRKPPVPEYNWPEEKKPAGLKNKFFVTTSILAVLVVMVAGGYGFYALGQKEALLNKTKEVVVVKAPEGAETGGAAAGVKTAAGKSQSLLGNDVKAPGATEIAPGGNPASTSADPASGIIADRLPEEAVETAMPDSIKAGNEAGGTAMKSAPSGTLPAPAETPAAPVETLPALDGTLPGPVGTPAPPVEAPTVLAEAPSAPAEMLPKPAETPVAPAETLDSLTKSVTEAIIALGKPSGGAAAMSDPAGELRIRMTRLVSAAAGEGKPLSEVSRILENELAGLPADNVPDVLKNAQGKIDVTTLLSAIAPTADKSR